MFKVLKIVPVSDPHEIATGEVYLNVPTLRTCQRVKPTVPTGDGSVLSVDLNTGIEFNDYGPSARITYVDLVTV